MSNPRMRRIVGGALVLFLGLGCGDFNRMSVRPVVPPSAPKPIFARVAPPVPPGARRPLTPAQRRHEEAELRADLKRIQSDYDRDYGAGIDPLLRPARMTDAVSRELSRSGLRRIRAASVTFEERTLAAVDRAERVLWQVGPDVRRERALERQETLANREASLRVTDAAIEILDVADRSQPSPDPDDRREAVVPEGDELSRMNQAVHRYNEAMIAFDRVVAPMKARRKALLRKRASARFLRVERRA